jgi:hypothetical protein
MRMRKDPSGQKHMEIPPGHPYIQGIQSPEDKGYPKCVWRIRLYQQPDMDTFLQKEDRKTFLDFMKRLDQKYDDSIRQIFLVLDNVSIHKSNKVKET